MIEFSVHDLQLRLLAAQLKNRQLPTEELASYIELTAKRLQRRWCMSIARARGPAHELAEVVRQHGHHCEVLPNGRLAIGDLSDHIEVIAPTASAVYEWLGY